MKGQRIELYDLRCNYQHEPMAVDDAPVFSWKVSSERQGDSQTGYRLLVKTGGNLIWDSGIVNSSDHCAVSYQGPALAAKTQYQWEVAVLRIVPSVVTLIFISRELFPSISI